jgi:hypothetical protein
MLQETGAEAVAATALPAESARYRQFMLGSHHPGPFEADIVLIPLHFLTIDALLFYVNNRVGIAQQHS